MSSTLFFWLAFGVGFGLLASLPGRTGFGPSSAILRFFVPSYRFFESAPSTIEFEFRRGIAGEPWRPVVPIAKRSFRSMFLDAEGSFRLFAYQLVDEFLCELEERGPTPLHVAESLQSFDRLERVCRHYRRQVLGDQAFQLRVVSIDAAAEGSSEVLFESTLQAAPSDSSSSTRDP